jgi:hypothetical protein
MSLVKTYVSGRQTGSIPRINYSTDLGVTWVPTNFNTNSSLINAITVRQDDPNFILVGTTYVNGNTNNLGIQYSADGGITWTQSGGSWLGTVASNSLIGSSNLIVLDSDSSNTIIYTTATDFVGSVRLLRSNDNGYTFSAIATSNVIYGSGNYSIYALAAYDVNVFVAVGAGTGPNPMRVYKSTNYGSTFSLLGTVGASNNIGALYYDQPNDVLYAVAMDGVYSSTAGGAFVLEYLFPNAHFVQFTIKGIDYIDGLLYFNDRTTVYSADTTFSTVTAVYTTGPNNIQDFDFYLAGKGFVIANGVDTLYTPDNGININNTNNDIDFGPEYVTISSIVGCGCEPGFAWDEASQQCITMTPMCPEGMIYNPATGDCEGATVSPCETDIAIAIDISGSIVDAEMPEYKNMLRGIIDGLEMGYDVNGNLNTIANSLGRITSGEIRVGLVFFTTTPFTIAGGVTLNYGPTAWQSGGALNSPAGTVANPGLLKNIINYMGVTTGPGTDSYGIPFLSKGTGYTNSFAALGRAYDLLWGANSRPTANKKILFTTDGWPNYIDPATLISTYGVTLPSIISSFGTTPANAVCGAYGVNDINSVIQATYQDRRLADYIATMDLAQEIKAGTAVPSAGTGGAADIVLVITGNTLEQNITKGAFVGVNPTDLSTACYLDNSSIFGSSSKDGSDNFVTVGGQISVGDCPSWQGSYTTLDKFPSDNPAGLPDYYQTDLIPSSYAAITLPTVTSLLCNTAVVSSVTCDAPCEIVTEGTPTVYYCKCISSIPFNTCCYDLINCADNTVYASVNTTGQNIDFMAPFIGQYIFIEGVEACLYVSLNNACTSSTTLNITVDQITAYTDCIDCNQDNEVTPYYNLIKCGETTPMFQTTTDLSSYLTGGANQNLPILTFVEYPDICFTVVETFTFLPQVVVTVDVAYNDCPTCLSYLC